MRVSVVLWATVLVVSGSASLESPAEELPSHPSLLEFVRGRSKRYIEHVPRKVLTFYYTWYGRPERHGHWVHWGRVSPEKHDISASTHYPTLGAYDSHDPELIRKHLAMMKENGIDGLIATWWGRGRFEDRAFEIVLREAEKAGVEATVYWETAPGSGREQVQQAIDDLVYILTRYAGSPAFLKLDGKPVIFVYGRVMGQMPSASWPAVIEGVQKRWKKDFLLIADGYNEAYARIFDGVHTYNVAGSCRDRTPDQIRTWAARAYPDAVAVARRFGRIACLTVIPGYDDTKIRKPGLRVPRYDGQTYRTLWEAAIQAQPDWVLITSFNEWHEGSEIEPSIEYGDLYLRLTREFSARFKASPPPRRTRPSSGGLSPEAAETLRRLLDGCTIGVLPEYGGPSVFLLADAGVRLEELTWEDVVAPDRLNPKRLPILLYASGERYRRTIHRRGDVDAALRRYLRAGGLLLVMSWQPFPFYYDETGRSIKAAARFGLPIIGSLVDRPADALRRGEICGWEKPPAGRRLVFRLAPELGRPREVPFPKSGDLRWRPCSPKSLAPGDEYVPLARLLDAETRDWLGDGIAYIHHRASEPKNARLLYVWMRMPDILPPDEFLPRLFRFAVEKIRNARPN